MSVVKTPYPSKKAEVKQMMRLKVLAIKSIGCELVRRLSTLEDTEDSVSTASLLLLLRKLVADGGDPWG